MEDTPRYLIEDEQRATRELEQSEWEADADYALYHPKPPKRYRASKTDWGKLRAHFTDRTCVVCGRRWESLHHIYKRSQGGDDVFGNLVPVCGSGTTGCHGKIEARDPAALAAVRESLQDAHRWYLTWKLKHGAPAWLDNAYPEAA